MPTDPFEEVQQHVVDHLGLLDLRAVAGLSITAERPLRYLRGDLGRPARRQEFVAPPSTTRVGTVMRS